MVTGWLKTARANPLTALSKGEEGCWSYQQSAGALRPLGLEELKVMVIGSQEVSAAWSPVGSAEMV